MRDVNSLSEEELTKVYGGNDKPTPESIIRTEHKKVSPGIERRERTVEERINCESKKSGAKYKYVNPKSR